MKTNFLIKKQQITVESAQIDIFGYLIRVDVNGITESIFKVSLQPTGDPDVLPTFQLYPQSKKISNETRALLPRISDWLCDKIRKDDLF